MDLSPVKKQTPRIKIKDVEEYLQCDYKKVNDEVEEMALSMLIENAPAMPSVVSFALLDFDEFIKAFMKLLDTQSDFVSPKHTSMLFLMTEAVVLSYANPPLLCGLFGNGFVNSKGYKNFKRVAMGLEKHWHSVLRWHFSNLPSIDMKEAKMRLNSIRSISKLLRDLDYRSGNMVKAIDLAGLATSADFSVGLMSEKIRKKAEQENKIPNRPPPPAKGKPLLQVNQPQSTSLKGQITNKPHHAPKQTLPMPQAKPADRILSNQMANKPEPARNMFGAHQPKDRVVPLLQSSKPLAPIFLKKPNTSAQVHKVNCTTNANMRSPEKRKGMKALLEKCEKLSYHKALKRPYPSPKKTGMLSPVKKMCLESEVMKENRKSRARTPSFSDSDASTSDLDSETEEDIDLGDLPTFGGSDSSDGTLFHMRSMSSPSLASSPLKLPSISSSNSALPTSSPYKVPNSSPNKQSVSSGGSSPRKSWVSSPTLEDVESDLETSPPPVLPPKSPESPSSSEYDEKFYGKYKFLQM